MVAKQEKGVNPTRKDCELDGTAARNIYQRIEVATRFPQADRDNHGPL